MLLSSDQNENEEKKDTLIFEDNENNIINNNKNELKNNIIDTTNHLNNKDKKEGSDIVKVNNNEEELFDTNSFRDVKTDEGHINYLFTKFKSTNKLVEDLNINIFKNKNKYELRDVIMNMNNNSDNKKIECKNIEFFLIFTSIIHFYVISEINGILFALLEEMKKYFHSLGKKDGYNEDKNFYDFFKRTVLYDSSQINFNYVTSLFTNILISSFNVVYTYLLCLIFIIASLLSLYFFHLSDLSKENPNEFYHFLKIVVFYALIYVFTGIIGYLPFQILENKNNHWNIYLLNFSSFIGVAIKNLIHYYIYLKYITNNTEFFFYKFALFVLLSFIYNVILYIINKKKKKNYPIYDYNLGVLSFQNAYSKIKIRFQKTSQYICNLMKEDKFRIWFIFFINLFSRTQKVMFKSKFKDDFEENLYMLLNMFFSHALYLIIIVIYNIWEYSCKLKGENETKINNEKNDEIKSIKEKIQSIKLKSRDREKFIYKLIIIENSLSFILNIIYIFSYKGKAISFFTVLLGGTINFILAEYYPTQKIQYLSLSGIISISNLLFRGTEFLYSVFKNDIIWNVAQIISSYSGIGLCICLLIN